MSNKIIHTPLTRQTVIDAAAAMQRLAQPQSKIFTKENSAQRKTDEAFLHSILIAHASEFLGSWLVANDEYQPLVNGISSILRRCNAHNAEIAAQLNEATDKSRGGLI